MKRRAAAVFGVLFLLGLCLFPARASGEVLRFSLHLEEIFPEKGADFQLVLQLQTEGGAAPTALRFHLLYDTRVLTFSDLQTPSVGDFFQTAGKFGMKVYPANSELHRYPENITATDRAHYAVVVIQWYSFPVVPISAASPVPLLTLQFHTKEDPPALPEGSKIYIPADFSYENTPFVDPYAVDTTAATCVVRPKFSIATLETKIGTDGKLSLDPTTKFLLCTLPLSKTGSVLVWDDRIVGNYFRITENGVFDLNHSAKPENTDIMGTGSVFEVWNANKSQSVGKFPIVILGDLDGNGLVDLEDYSILQELLATPSHEKLQTGSPYRFAADLNGDGSVDELDLQLLLSRTLGP